MHRVKDPADPHRCKGAAPDGQCMNEAEHGSEYCKAHGGVDTQNDEDIRSYLLSQADYRRRLAQLQQHQEPIRELKDAIALTHMLIEKRFNLVKTDADVMAACGPLNQLLLTMERLVKSALQLEQNLGSLLTKTSVLNLGQVMVTIIVDELSELPNYESIVDRITNRLFKSIEVSSNQEQS